MPSLWRAIYSIRFGILNKPTQRRCVDPIEHIRQLTIASDTGRELRSVDIPQRADQGIAVLPGDCAVFVAMSVIESGLLHVYLPESAGVAVSKRVPTFDG